jgi:hypothetical protein
VKLLFLGCFVLAAPAAAQTPLCAWDGSGLACPTQSMPTVPYRPVEPTQPPTIAEHIARLNEQAAFDRALAVTRAERDLEDRQATAQAEARAGGGYCSGGERLNADSAEPGLELLHSRCRAPRR